MATMAEWYDEILEEVYAGLPKISVNYGILEREDNILVMLGDFCLGRHRVMDGPGAVFFKSITTLDFTK